MAHPIRLKGKKLQPGNTLGIMVYIQYRPSKSKSFLNTESAFALTKQSLTSAAQQGVCRLGWKPLCPFRACRTKQIEDVRRTFLEN